VHLLSKFLLTYATHLAVVVALIPGSLIFIAVVLWRAARAAIGFSMPSMPLRSSTGAIVCTEDDWRRHTKAEFPIRYGLFESFPRFLARVGRNIVRPFRLRTSKEAILFKAFGVFADWVEANGDLAYVLEDEDPIQQELDHCAEIYALYDWWKDERPRAVRRIEEASLDNREHLLVEFDQDDEIHFARLANLWRTLI
jgi:hypothetical protein